MFSKKVAKKRLVYVSLASLCLFSLNFRHVLDLGFHHVLERKVDRLILK
jgi:hypothetical protein